MRNTLRVVLALGLLSPLFATVACAVDPEASFGEDESLEGEAAQTCTSAAGCPRGQWCDSGTCKPGCDEESDCQQFSGGWGTQQRCNTSRHQCETY